MAIGLATVWTLFELKGQCSDTEGCRELEENRVDFSPFIPSWSWRRLQKSLFHDLPRKPEADSGCAISTRDANHSWVSYEEVGIPYDQPTDCVTSARQELFLVMSSSKSENRHLKSLWGGRELSA